MKHISLDVVLFMCVLGCAGCSTTNAFSYRASGTNFRDVPEGILGLPLVINNLKLNPTCRTDMEIQIDTAMQKTFGAQYKPIASTRKDYSSLAEPLAVALGTSCRTALQMEIQKTNLLTLATTSKCRYALLPRTVGHEVITQWGFNMVYVVPVGYIIIYGVAPFRVGASSVEHMPVYTLWLVDMQNATVLAEEIYATKTDMTEENMNFPKEPIQRLKKYWSKGGIPTSPSLWRKQQP